MFLLSTKTFYSSYTVEKFLHPGTSFIVREALHINKVSNATCYKNQSDSTMQKRIYSLIM